MLGPVAVDLDQEFVRDAAQLLAQALAITAVSSLVRSRTIA